MARQTREELEEDLNYDSSVLVQQTDQLVFRLQGESPAPSSPLVADRGSQSAQEAYDRLLVLKMKSDRDVIFRKKWTVQQNAAGRTGEDLILRLNALLKKYQSLEKESQP
jgi:hypothetical protein